MYLWNYSIKITWLLSRLSRKTERLCIFNAEMNVCFSGSKSPMDFRILEFFRKNSLIPKIRFQKKNFEQTSQFIAESKFFSEFFWFPKFLIFCHNFQYRISTSIKASALQSNNKKVANYRSKIEILPCIFYCSISKVIFLLNR